MSLDSEKSYIHQSFLPNQLEYLFYLILKQIEAMATLDKVQKYVNPEN